MQLPPDNISIKISPHEVKILDQWKLVFKPMSYWGLLHQYNDQLEAVGQKM